jgi:hypothetical protein
MSVPTWAGFVTRIPDDEVATGQEIAVYGGRNVAVTVGETFAGLGCSHVSDPHYGGEMGWDFRFRYDGRHSFWCRVQSFHPIYWLLLEGPGGNRGEPAHLELWRKFADALEQDARFDQILWRTSKEGPPDWDEFTLTADLPPRRVLKELPPQPARRGTKAAGGSSTPVIIGIWCALVVAVIVFVDNIVHSAKEQSRVESLAIAGLLAALAIVLPMIDWRRKRKLQSSGRDPDSAP